MQPAAFPFLLSTVFWTLEMLNAKSVIRYSVVHTSTGERTWYCGENSSGRRRMYKCNVVSYTFCIPKAVKSGRSGRKQGSSSFSHWEQWNQSNYQLTLIRFTSPGNVFKCTISYISVSPLSYVVSLHWKVFTSLVTLTNCIFNAAASLYCI